MNKKNRFSIKKLNIKQRRKLFKAICRTTAFGLAASMCFSAMFSDFESEWLPDISISSKLNADDIYEFRTLGEAGIEYADNTININNALQLIKLSHVDPSEYFDKNITISNTSIHSSIDLASSENMAFQGLGNDANPFCGHFYASESDAFIIGNSSLFRTLSTEAEISRINFRVSGDNIQNPAFAQRIVGDGEHVLDVSVVINESKVNSEKCDNFGGIIGKIESNASVSLKVTNNVSIKEHLNSDNDGFLRCHKSGNAGFFCSEIYDSSINIEYICNGSSDTVSDDSCMLSVISDNENAGLAVGYAENSEISVDKSMNLYGQVFALKSAGGFIGYAENTKVLINGDNGEINLGTKVTSRVTLNNDSIGDRHYYGLLVNGKDYSGGFIGYMKNADNNTDYSKIKIRLSVINKDDNGKFGANITQNTSCIGTVYGFLYNTGESHSLSINNINEAVLYSSVASSAAQPLTVGGIIGEYTSDSLSDELKINNVNPEINITAASAVLGGIIGNIKKISENGVYVNIYDSSVNYKNVNKPVTAGGIIGSSAGADFIDIGSVAVTGKFTENTISAAGGIAGSMEYGVIRLSGTTNLNGSEFHAAEEVKSIGQILGKRGSVLVYAADGWSLKRPKAAALSDIGSWGEVLRLDTGNITEGKPDQEDSGDNIFVEFDSAAHTVKVKNIKTDISSVRDFAALAARLSCADSCASLLFEENESIPKNTDPLSWKISVSKDIDLSKTGITGFLRDDGTQIFEGTLVGMGHTLKVSVGEAYGDRTTGEGCGQIYFHSHSGLFAKTMNAGVKSINISGTMEIKSGDSLGMLTGEIVRDETHENLDISEFSKLPGTITEVTVDSNAQITSYNLKNVGGIAGLNNDNRQVLENCKWQGKIDEKNESEIAIGGFIGKAAGSLRIQGVSTCTGGTLNQCNTNKSGGLIGVIEGENEKVNDNQTYIEIYDVIVDGLNIKSDANTKSASGGFLGYSWNRSKIYFTNIKIKNSTLVTYGVFGGLLYSGSGHWLVGYGRDSEHNGIKFESNNSFTGKTNTKNPSSLFVARADNLNDSGALLLEINRNKTELTYYCVKDSVNLNISDENNESSIYFDEIAGRTISDNGNGIVSVSINGYFNKFDEKNKVDSESINTYRKQLENDYENPNTRYYYNLDTIFDKPDNKKIKENGVDTPEKLMAYSLYEYSDDYLSDYFADGPASLITGDIDISGYSYYPAAVSSDINIESCTIKFDNESIENKESESDNKKTSDKNKQHYLMQTGLFSVVENTDASVNFTVNDLTLQGTTGKTDSNCGALINDYACGSNQGEINLRLNDIALDGIRITGYSTGYAPLLINRILSYSNVNISGVKTTDKYNTDEKKTPDAASSLLGNTGEENSGYININFSDIALNARTRDGEILCSTYSSIFSNASLMYSFSYSGNTSSGQYNFSNEPNNYTYGKELSNRLGTTGRNPGKQFKYMNDDQIINDGEVYANIEPGFNTDSYLRYVYIPENYNNNSYSHEIDINQRVENVVEGCGTYDDPYVIDKGGQLEALAMYLSGQNMPKWSVCFDSNLLDKGNGSEHNPDNHKKYKYDSLKHKWMDDIGSEQNASEYEMEKFTQYLRNAYYQIKCDITLGESGTYSGIGSYNIASASASQGASFCGVITGKKQDDGSWPEITVVAPFSPQSNFGGLVNYGSGCVIKDLVINYEKCKESKINIRVDKERRGSGIIHSRSSNKDAGNDVTSPVAQYPQNQVFFGGVIGYAFGGDNIIDNVEVKGLDEAVKVTGDYYDGTHIANIDYLANIGGYAGLAGGNALGKGTVGKYGGGVVFRNTNPGLDFHVVYNDYNNPENTVKSVSASAEPNYETYYYDDDNITEEALKNDAVNNTTLLKNTDQYFYLNPYVGRVLDGYVCSEDSSLNNTDKNYTIPTLSDTKSLNVSEGTVDVNDAQALWVLSAIVNSGAGYIENGVYSENAYRYGKVRTGLYNNIGSDIDQGAAADETFWGGNGDSSAGKISYLVKKYQVTDEVLQSYNTVSHPAETTETITRTVKQVNNYDAFAYNAVNIDEQSQTIVFSTSKHKNLYTLVKINTDESVNLSIEDYERKIHCYVVYSSDPKTIKSNDINNTQVYKFPDGKYEHCISGTDNFTFEVNDIVNSNIISGTNRNNLYLLVMIEGSGNNLSKDADKNALLSSLNMSVKINDTDKTPEKTAGNYKSIDGIYMQRKTPAYTSNKSTVLFNTTYVSKGVKYNASQASVVEISLNKDYSAKFYIASSSNLNNSGNVYMYNDSYENFLENGNIVLDLKKFRYDYGMSDTAALYVLVTFTDQENSDINYNRQTDQSLNLLSNSEFTYCVRNSSNEVIYSYEAEHFGMADEITFATSKFNVADWQFSNYFTPDGLTVESKYIFKPVSLDSISSSAESIKITNTTGKTIYYSIINTDKIYSAYVINKKDGMVQVNNGSYVTENLSQYGVNGLYLMVMVDIGSSADFYKTINIGFTYELTTRKISTSGVVYNNININNDCDMTEYGNGFRGIGTGYTDNITKLIQSRTVSVKTLNGKGNEIILSRNGLEYSEETWWTQAEGLFPVYNFQDMDCSVNNLTVKGDIRIYYADMDYMPKAGKEDIKYKSGSASYGFTAYDAFIGECCLGGYGGMSAYNNYYANTNKAYTHAEGAQINNVGFNSFRVENLNVEGGKYSGGFLGVAGQSNRIFRRVWEYESSKEGFNWESTSTDYNPVTIGSVTGNYTFDSCGYSDLNIKGSFSSGGFISCVKNNTEKNGQRIVLVKGKTKIDGDNNFFITRDAVYEYLMHTTNPYKDNDQPNNGDSAGKYFCYVGAGGIIGYCDAALYINNYVNNAVVTAPEDPYKNYGLKDSLELSGLKITAPNISYNTDYGIGIVCGSVNYNDKESLSSVNPTVICNVTVKKSYVGTPLNEKYANTVRLRSNTSDESSDQDIQYPFIGEKNRPFYRNYNAGGIAGYVKSKMYVYNCTVDDSVMENSPYSGGIIANKGSNSLYILKTTVHDCIIYNSYGVASKRTSGSGGLVGHLNAVSNIYDCKISDNYIISNGSSGGIAGYTGNSPKIKDLTVSNNVIVSTKSMANHKAVKTDMECTRSVENGAKTASSDTPAETKNEYGYYSKAGGLFGSQSGTGKTTQGYNLMLNNNHIGYVLNNKGSIYSYDNGGDFCDDYPVKTVHNSYEFENQKISLKNYLKENNYNHIGVISQYTPAVKDAKYTKNADDAVYVPLSETGNNNYTEGFEGSIIGYSEDSNTFQILGYSIQGEHQPYEYNGYKNYSSSNSYIIRADYTGSSLEENHNKGNNNTSDTHVTVNPVLKDSVMEFTGDGTSYLARDNIIDGLTVTEIPENYPNTYSFSSDLIKYAKQLNECLIEKNNESVSSNIELKKFGEIGDRESSVPEPWYNMPVIYINTNDASAINEMLQKYISVMTGTDQLAGANNDISQNKSLVSRRKHLYTKDITSVAYQYQTVNGSGKWVKNGAPSIVAAKKDKGSEYIEFRNESGIHDNGGAYPQFTMLDIPYKSPIDKDTTYYHLYIPVYVKRVMAFSYHATVLNDTRYAPSDYDETRIHVISNFDDKVTAFISYNYYRSADEWKNALVGGENLLWNFRKRIYLGKKKLPDGSVLTLVDHNTGGMAYTLTVDDSVLKITGDNYYIELDDFTEPIGRKSGGWSDNAALLCDMLKLSVTEVKITSEDAYTGKFIKCSTDTDKKNATFRVKSENDYLYFRPAAETDIQKDSKGNIITKLYDVLVDENTISKITDSNFCINKGIISDENTAYLEESYYLTIMAEQGEDSMINNVMEYPLQTLGEAGYISITDDSFSMPTVKGNQEAGNDMYNYTRFSDDSGSNRYIFSNCLKQEVPEISSESSDKTTVVSPENSEIFLTMTNDVEITDQELKRYIGIGISNDDTDPDVDDNSVKLFQEYVVGVKEVDGKSVQDRRFHNECSIKYQFEVTGKKDGITYYGQVRQLTDFEDTLHLAADTIFKYTDQNNVEHKEKLIKILYKNTDVGSEKSGITVSCKTDITYSEEGIGEFPVIEGQKTDEGFVFNVTSYFAYSENSLLSSSINAHNEDDSYYHSEKKSTAKLNYSSVSAKDASGQLGINPVELKEKGKDNQVINSAVLYNFSSVKSDDVDSCDNIQYEMTLHVKSSDDTYSESLDFRKYFGKLDDDNNSLVNINSNQTPFEISDDGKRITWTEPADKNSYQQTSSIIYSIVSGDDFEGNDLTYANYKVLIKASLVDRNNSDKHYGEAEDYLIFTHAKNLLEVYMKDE